MSKTGFAFVLLSGALVAACSGEPPPPLGGAGGWTGGAGGAYPGSGGTGGAGGVGSVCSGPVASGALPSGVVMNEVCRGHATQGPYTGYVYTFSDKPDGGGSAVCPDCGELACTPVLRNLCVSGIAGKVQGTAYSTYWGAGLGWYLNQPTSAPDCLGGVPGLVDLTGKIIDATIDNPPPVLRLELVLDDPAAIMCVDISSQSNVHVRTADFVSECWTGGAKVPISAAQLSSVKAIHFVVPTNTSDDVPFSFCITSLGIQ